MSKRLFLQRMLGVSLLTAALLGVMGLAFSADQATTGLLEVIQVDPNARLKPLWKPSESAVKQPKATTVQQPTRHRKSQHKKVWTDSKKARQHVVWMEEAVFSASYAKEGIETRLARLEQKLFGVTNPSLSEKERIIRLHTAMLERKQAAAAAQSKPFKLETASGLPETLATTPTKNPAIVEKPADAANRVAHSVPHKKPKTKTSKPKSLLKRGKRPVAQLEKDVASLPEPTKTQPTATRSPQTLPEHQTPAQETAQYPVISTMEHKVFGQTHPHQPLEKRLGRLEASVFGVPQRGPLFARVDNLRLVVLGDAVVTPPSVSDISGAPARTGKGPYPQSATQSQPQSQTPPQLQQFPGIPPQNAASPVHTSLSSGLTRLESSVLRQSFPYEPDSKRLDRLEMAVFNRIAPGDVSNEDRFDRLSAVAVAKDEPPFSQTVNGNRPGGSYQPKKQGIKSLIPFIIMGALMLL